MTITIEDIDSLDKRDITILKHLKECPFIKDVKIRKIFYATKDSYYTVNVEIDPSSEVSIHVFDDEIQLVENKTRYTTYIYCDRASYYRLEII